MTQMGFGERLIEIRKKRGWSQDKLAKLLGTHAPAIGRYERDLAKPTIEVAGKIAALLGISLDYLVGNSDQELDSNTLKRIMEIQKLPEDIKEKIYYFIDISIKDFKTRTTYSS